MLNTSIGSWRGRKGQAQFLLRVPKNFDAALPFGDELALAILHYLRRLTCGSFMPVRLGPLNCFDGSDHLLLSLVEQSSACERSVFSINSATVLLIETVPRRIPFDHRLVGEMSGPGKTAISPAAESGRSRRQCW
jgi:hypothetical protein